MNRSSGRSPSAATSRGLWAVVIVLTGALVGIVAALLSTAAGFGLPTAILTGGSAFAAAVIMQLAILHFVMTDQSR